MSKSKSASKLVKKYLPPVPGDHLLGVYYSHRRYLGRIFRCIGWRLKYPDSSRYSAKGRRAEIRVKACHGLANFWCDESELNRDTQPQSPPVAGEFVMCVVKDSRLHYHVEGSRTTTSLKLAKKYPEGAVDLMAKYQESVYAVGNELVPVVYNFSDCFFVPLLEAQSRDYSDDSTSSVYHLEKNIGSRREPETVYWHKNGTGWTHDLAWAREYTHAEASASTADDKHGGEFTRVQ